MIANYHTHNVFCGHAEGTIEEYTVKAIERGLLELGHSDHFPFCFDVLNDGRMKYEDLHIYLDEVERMKGKYKDKIKVFTGGEIEYLSDFGKYYERLLNSKAVDYFILGQHFYSPDGFRYVNVYVDFKNDNPPVMDYAKSCMDGMKTGYFLYLAHPDLIFLNDLVKGGKLSDECKRAISYMVEESVKNDYVLELNGGGYNCLEEFSDGMRHPYPVRYFWEEVAKTNIRCIIGSDAHHPDAVYNKSHDELKEKALSMGLNLVERLDID